jgi:phosphatidate cytidylyltransferase
MHLKRWLTGIIAVPILIFLVGPGPRWAFYILIYFASLIGLIEFYKITASNLPKLIRWSNYLLTLLLFVILYLRGIYYAPFIIALWALVPMIFSMLSFHSPDTQSTGDIGKALLGPIYVVLPLAMLLLIDRYPKGNIWIFFLLTVIFASDTGAFYIGKLFGKHKLYEAVSPGKTWEGAIGGLLSSLIAALLFLQILDIHPLNLNLLFLVLALSVSGQIGDLVESMLKRNHGVKDSGHILPGHGGVLDRIDGLLFAIPIIYVYISLCVTV